MVKLSKAAAYLLHNAVARAVKHNAPRHKYCWDLPKPKYSKPKTRERVRVFNPLAEMQGATVL
jgi:hypothetical protein